MIVVGHEAVAYRWLLGWGVAHMGGNFSIWVRSIPSIRETQYMPGNLAPRSWRQKEASLKRTFMPGLQEDGVLKSSLAV